MSKNIDDVLNFDALDTADKMTGESYKDNKDTARLGFAMFMENNKRKENMLQEMNDTYFNMSYAELLDMLESRGFERIFEEEFEGGNIHCIHWRDGILLNSTSYRWSDEKVSVNDIKAYFNYEVEDTSVPFSMPLSGCFDRDQYDRGNYVFVGNMDAREGFFYRLEEMEKKGTFRKIWTSRPVVMDLMNFAEAKGGNNEWDYRVADLPESVRDAIGTDVV